MKYRYYVRYKEDALRFICIAKASHEPSLIALVFVVFNFQSFMFLELDSLRRSTDASQLPNCNLSIFYTK